MESDWGDDISNDFLTKKFWLATCFCLTNDCYTVHQYSCIAGWVVEFFQWPTKGTQQSDICLFYLINMIVHLLVFWSFYMHIFMWFPALIFIYSYKIQRAIRWQIEANSKLFSSVLIPSVKSRKQPRPLYQLKREYTWKQFWICFDLPTNCTLYFIWIQRYEYMNIKAGNHMKICI